MVSIFSFVVDFEATALSVALEALERSNTLPEHCSYTLSHGGPNDSNNFNVCFNIQKIDFCI